MLLPLLPLLLAATPATAHRPPPPETRPVSFLIVITDDQRNDMLSCAGHPVLSTPVMDALAARGSRFENAFVTTPICAASRASILTSRYEANHGFTFGTEPLAKELTGESWPVRLREAGWRTAHVGKWGMSTEARPGDLFDAFIPLRPPYLRTDPDGSVNHLTDITANHATAFLGELAADDAFALTLSFNAPHAEDANPRQYIWAEEEAALYADVEIPVPALASEVAYRALPPFLQTAMGRERWGWRFDTEEKRAAMTRGYYRMISGVDRNLGRVLQRLEELGRTRDTVVILMGDNGYFLGERGLAGKWLIYEESIRVPLIVVDPRLGPSGQGRVPKELALNIDIGPTVLALAGLEMPRSYQGASVVPLLSGEATPWRSEFLVEHHMENARLPKHRGLRTKEWAYSVFYEQEPPFELLFDLQADPDQLRNLASEPKCRETLLELRRRTLAQVQLLSPKK